MAIDRFQSRRNYNEYCRWWSMEDGDDSELAHDRIADGSFWAKKAAAEDVTDVIVGGAFMFDKDAVTLKTPDNLDGIREHDLVEYRGEKWLVTSVQKSDARLQNTQYAKESACSHFWYVGLRK